MSYFQLTNGTSTYEFDTRGAVSIGGNTVGSWTTSATNQIVTTLTGAVVSFDVSWLFNDKNQLTIQSQNAEIFNFAAVGLRNSFTTRDTALIVKPDLLSAFTFPLQGDWTMSPDHNLTFTACGVTSTLDGFVSDPIGRFIFHFANLDNVLETNVLGFIGSWQSKVDPSGTPLLDFHYQTASGEKIFELPKAVIINRSSNQLSYTYTKGNKNLSIDFQGTLMIGADFQITYVVQPQVSSSGDQMVASTTLGFNATLTQPNLHGDLQLTVTKPDGTAGASTLTIGGQCQGVLGKTSSAGRLHVHANLRWRGKPDHQNRGIQRDARVQRRPSPVDLQRHGNNHQSGGGRGHQAGARPVGCAAQPAHGCGGQTAGVKVTFLLGVNF